MRKEDKLREKIKKLLEEIKHPEERIKDLHGSHECGLDLVLLKFDPFFKLRTFGIQIKSGDIKCSGPPSLKIKEIIGQLAIAYGRLINIDGHNYTLEGFYVVTDGEINPQAQSYIQSALIGIRNLYFIDGQALKEFEARCGSKEKQFSET